MQDPKCAAVRSCSKLKMLCWSLPILGFSGSIQVFETKQRSMKSAVSEVASSGSGVIPTSGRGEPIDPKPQDLLGVARTSSAPKGPCRYVVYTRTQHGSYDII